MHTTAARIRYLAERLIAAEAKMASRHSANSEAFLVCEKLRTPLAALVGDLGFRALLGRALTLAGSEFPWMHGVYLTADLSLGGLDDRAAQIDPAEFSKGELLLIARLLELLQASISENLMLRLILEVWPELSDNSGSD